MCLSSSDRILHPPFFCDSKMGQASTRCGKPSGMVSLCTAASISILTVIALLLYTGASFTFVSYDMLENDGLLAVPDWSGDNTGGDEPIWAMVMLWVSFLFSLIGFAVFAYYYHLARSQMKTNFRCLSSWCALINFALAALFGLIALSWFIALYVRGPALHQVDSDYYLIQMSLSIVAGVFVTLASILVCTGAFCCFGSDNQGRGNSTPTREDKENNKALRAQKKAAAMETPSKSKSIRSSSSVIGNASNKSYHKL